MDVSASRTAAITSLSTYLCWVYTFTCFDREVAKRFIQHETPHCVAAIGTASVMIYIYIVKVPQIYPGETLFCFSTTPP